VPTRFDTEALDATLTSLPQQPVSAVEMAASQGPAPGATTLSSWLRALGDLQRSVAGSHEFFQQAARAVHDPGGLEGGLILLPSGHDWTLAASHLPWSDSPVVHRSELVEQAVSSKATIFHDTRKINQSLRNSALHSAVVSPVFDSAGNAIAAIYGFRSPNDKNNRRGIRRLEAQFVQVISDSISAAMTRMEAEADAARSRALLDQTFSPTVARHLENDPSFLNGKMTEVTVLFADLRGFSSISEAVGPKVTYELLTDVMDRFSAIISDHDGVVIDFFGDGLAAFWNAPIEQAEHPVFACLCASEMLDSLESLNQKWSSRLNRTLEAGIGLHTGMAQVGNSGSRTRLKYGPQGNTVNIASRIEGMTQQIGCPLIVSSATADRISAAMTIRRIYRSTLKGIKQPIDLYEVIPRAGQKFSSDHYKTFNQALIAFEANDWQKSIRLLSELQVTGAIMDPAVTFLKSRATEKATQDAVAIR
jgi:class 3 adenylate cyclase